MKLTVYRQASKTRSDGTVVYKGEDTPPYVDDQVLVVADGLGGAAAIRHQKFRPELFEPGQLVQTLFEGIFDDYSDERLVQYIVDSFFELFAVKDCYFANLNNMKKSGYFASRIVTAILLHELMCNEKCSAKALFEARKKAEEEGESDEYLKSLGEFFKKIIQDNLRKVAQNANLFYETSYEKMALLGTTLCATIYLEHDDCVEAIYLTAGDSRPYVWEPQGGLHQVLADQERPDGGMSNYILANDDKDFDILCSYFKFPKPCVLFNASDGCFDAGYFSLCQLGFEKVILDFAKAASSVEELAEALTAYFKDYGRHDDSSTIAMKFFGFESFDAFKELANRRASALDEEYFAVMPELMDVDYAAEYAEAVKLLPRKMVELKKKVEEEEGTLEYCKDYVLSGKYVPYTEMIRKIDSDIEAMNIAIQEARKKIEKVIAENFVKFQPILGSEDNVWDKRRALKIEDADNKYQDRAADYLATIQGYRHDFEGAVTILRELLGKVYEIGVPKSFEAFDDLAYEIVEDCEKTMETLFDYFNGIKSKKLDMVRKLTQLREEYIQNNIKRAQKYPGALKEIRHLLESGELNLDDVKILEGDRKIIRAELDIIKELRAKVMRLDKEEKTTALRTAVEAYWEENHAEIIAVIIRDPSVKISEEVRQEAIEISEQAGKQAETLQEKSELQKQLFDKYTETYLQYMGGLAE